jgi:histidine ammonia-lyase
VYIQVIQAQDQQAAKQALKLLRSCGVGPKSEQQSVRQLLDAYLQSYGKQATPVTAVRALLARYDEQQPVTELYGWLTQISAA